MVLILHCRNVDCGADMTIAALILWVFGSLIYATGAGSKGNEFWHVYVILAIIALGSAIQFAAILLILPDADMVKVSQEQNATKELLDETLTENIELRRQLDNKQ
jgi:hypothetical protein